MRPVNLIVIHCSATASGKAISRGKPGQLGYINAAHVINDWHRERFRRQANAVQEFNPTLPNIGYHYVIDVSGEVLSGRSEGEVGAHAAGFNANSIGICLVGGVEREGRYTPAQWKELAKLVMWVAHVHRVPLSAPQRISKDDAFTLINGVCGHRDVSPDSNDDGKVDAREWLKTCPGFDVQGWLRGGLEPLANHLYLEA
jgi:N-acetylmuramoyl-L-alanine amidase